MEKESEVDDARCVSVSLLKGLFAWVIRFSESQGAGRGIDRQVGMKWGREGQEKTSRQSGT